MIPLRDENRVASVPLMTWALAAACVLTFLWQLSLGVQGFNRALFALGVIPAVLFGHAQLPPEIAIVPPAATAVTSMFLHGGWLHLAGNLLYLWIFGNNVEDRLGHLRFLLFYLGCGIAAAAAQIAPDPGSTIPMVGASGAISGVLGAYLVLFPRSRVVVFIPISFMLLHEIRAFWLLVIWFALQLVSAVAAPDSAGVAWWAHVGGFVAGAVVALPLVNRRRRGPWG